MKLYTPPEMSRKLVVLGCTSRSGMFWVDGKLKHESLITLRMFHSKIPAFEFEDFAGPGEKAKENSKKVFGKIDMEPDSANALRYALGGPINSCEARRRLIDSKNWVEEVGRGL